MAACSKEAAERIFFTVTHLETSSQVVSPPSHQPEELERGVKGSSGTLGLYSLIISCRAPYAGLMVSLCFSWTNAPARPPAPEFTYCKHKETQSHLTALSSTHFCFLSADLVGAPAGEVHAPVVQLQLHVSYSVGAVEADEASLTDAQRKD